MIDWKLMESDAELEELVNLSYETPCLVFKHSTRCSLSGMMLRRLENSMDISANIHLYLLNIISHRKVSNQLAEIFKVIHESPQVLLIQDGECIYNASHSYISAEAISEAIKS